MPSGNDFASIFSSAFQTPEAAGKELEFASAVPSAGRGFSSVGAGEAGKIAGATKYDFRVKRRVFLVYRPWERCQRCLDDVASGAVTPPAQGDLDCPHNELAAYEDVVNKILAGAYLFGSESEIANKDGTVAVSLRWYEPVQRPKKRKDAEVGEGP